MKKEMTRSSQPREKPASSPSTTPISVRDDGGDQAHDQRGPQAVDQPGEVVVRRVAARGRAGASQVNAVERRADLAGSR